MHNINSILYDNQRNLELEDLNTLLLMHGSQTITLEQFDRIENDIRRIEKVNNLGITGDNYKNDKIISYLKIQNKLKNSFNYNIPSIIPFDNPTEVKTLLYKFEKSLGLNDKQINILHKELVCHANIPKEKTIDKPFEMHVNKEGMIQLKVNPYISNIQKEEHYKQYNEDFNKLSELEKRQKIGIYDITLDFTETEFLDLYEKSKATSTKELINYIKSKL